MATPGSWYASASVVHRVSRIVPGASRKIRTDGIDSGLPNISEKYGIYEVSFGTFRNGNFDEENNVNDAFRVVRRANRPPDFRQCTTRILHFMPCLQAFF
jgi:hypothetical protein